MLFLIFDRDSLRSFQLVRAIDAGTAWQAAKHIIPDMGEYPPQHGDQYDLISVGEPINAEILQSPPD